MSQALTAEMDKASSSLASRWQQYRTDNPRTRTRDAAAALRVSEAELIATACGEAATRLNGDWRGLVGEMQRLGPVMALSRNEHAVHEKIGTFGKLSHSGAHGILLGDIDLRLFFSHWAHGFAVQEVSPRGTRDCLQFFDQYGDAIHKIYLIDESDRQVFNALVDAYEGDDQSNTQAVLTRLHQIPDRPDDHIDADALRVHWEALQDTHDFNDLLRRFGAGRRQAFRLVNDDLARSVAKDAPRRILEHVAGESIDIMLFVANPGIVQIHTGPVKNLKTVGPWFNVLDETFNLHLRETAIDSAWVVNKPTRDGVIGSREAFDAEGGLICQIFGRRKPGQIEDPAWRSVLNGIAS